MKKFYLILRIIISLMLIYVIGKNLFLPNIFTKNNQEKAELIIPK